MPRLIDADAILESLRLYAGDYMGHDGFYNTNAVKILIKLAPTIDAAPVVHGRWILLGKNEHNYETSVEEKCSLCGRYVYRYDTQPQDNFCPNCGAHMIGGDNNG